MNTIRFANKSNLFPYNSVTPNKGRTNIRAINDFVDSIIRKSSSELQAYTDWNKVSPTSSQLRLQTRQIPQNKRFNKKA